MIHKILNKLQTILLPSYCVGCHDTGTQNYDICQSCLAKLPQLTAQHCHYCALPLVDNHSFICGNCIASSPFYDTVICPLAYEAPLDCWVAGLKYSRKLYYANVFAAIMIEHLSRYYTQQPFPELLIPVPLHYWRQLRRGYNQALEIARPISKHFKIPLKTNYIRRIRSTQPQATVQANQRAANVTKAFKLDQPVTARHVALIDDVITTGHTVNSLAKLLKSNGVEKISVWGIARTLPHRLY